MGNPAARVGDMHTCPMVTGTVPHVGGPILTPSVPTVIIGGMPAAVLGDMCLCTGPPDSIMLGSFAVLFGGKPAARLGDPTLHGGIITFGLPTVLIGGPAIGALRPISIIPPKKSAKASSFPKIKYGPFIINYDPDNPDFQIRALAALIRLDNTAAMNAAFNDISSSGHTVKLSNYTSKDPNYKSLGPSNAYAVPDDRAAASMKGVGCGSKIAWNPNFHGSGSQEHQKPGSEVMLSHEVIHASHSANGTRGNTPLYDNNGNYRTNMEEERNTVGLAPSVYNNPPGWTGGPPSGSTLPDTTSPASASDGGPGNYTENQTRAQLAQQGYVNPQTGKAPVQRPSYGKLF